MSPLASSNSLERFDTEYEPLNVDPDAPFADNPDMGSGESFVKPEGRTGDVVAQWAAYVRPMPHSFHPLC